MWIWSLHRIYIYIRYVSFGGMDIVYHLHKRYTPCYKLILWGTGASIPPKTIPGNDFDSGKSLGWYSYNGSLNGIELPKLGRPILRHALVSFKATQESLRGAPLEFGCPNLRAKAPGL